MQSLITPRFSSPLFKLKTMAQPLQFANVSNALEVSKGSREFLRYVEVPATLFSVMRSLAVPQSVDVTLFLEQDGPRYLFGMVTSDDQLYDLWHYTHDALPAGLL